MSAAEIAARLTKEQRKALEWAESVAHGKGYCDMEQTFRALIERERAGGERAKVVAYLKEQAGFWRRDGHYGMQGVIDNLADAIEAGAHMAGAAKEGE